MSDGDARALEQWLGRTTEFPADAALPPNLTRRDFASLLGASLALAGLAGCVREPAEKILPYVAEPPDALPGTARHFATAMTLDGYATGLVVESRDGRPTKIEGNPDHPASLGAAGVYEQASLLQLYDPHRAQHARAGNRRTTWTAIASAFAPGALAPRVGARGAGLALLLEPTSSPLVSEMLARVRTIYPDARVYFHAPLESSTPLAAARALYGTALVPQYDFTTADVVVSIGADFLASGPFQLRYAHDFAAAPPNASVVGRRRLFVAETSPSPTGSLAQHRIAATPLERARLAGALFAAVREASMSASRDTPSVSANDASPALPAPHRAWVKAAAAALVANRSRAGVIAGERESADVHVLVHAINAAIGALGRTTWFTAPPILEAGEPSHDLSALAAELRTGQVDTLIVLDGNPAYAAPGDLDLERVIRSVRNTLYLGAYDDETARVSTWHVPAAHYLEAWGDARAYDGTLSVVQPLIAPLYGGRTPAEVLALLTGQNADAHALLREVRRAKVAGSIADDDRAWADALRRGVVDGSASPRLTPSGRRDVAASAYERVAVGRDSGTEIAFVPAAGVYDGRFGNNAWLQELPDPTTKLTWDNAALVSAATAAKLGLAAGDELALRLNGRMIALPALPVPGHADGVVSVALGYGRSGAEGTARDVGVNVNPLRHWSAPAADAGLSLARTGRTRALAITQSHWTLEGRGAEIVGPATMEPAPPPAPSASTLRPKRRPLTLYEPPPPTPGGFGSDQWAMVIDLDRCTGCSACVVACQAENNIPVVGRDGVLESREMHWIRIDRYLEGPRESPRILSQPMLCQHCEKAPCEYVCPVGATMHSDDGLNEMVYNRCVGTRFCSNNCPYKVRRFNWFDYNAEVAETERMAKNPDVTVRGRGVMEKCTFCVQRIRRAQRDAELDGDGAAAPVMTACMQTCPTRAIVFGSLTAPNSDVARLRDDPRAFSALASLGTEPRVRYLGRSDGTGDAAAVPPNEEPK